MADVFHRFPNFFLDTTESCFQCEMRFNSDLTATMKVFNGRGDRYFQTKTNDCKLDPSRSIIFLWMGEVVKGSLVGKRRRANGTDKSSENNR